MKPRTDYQKEVWALYNRPGYLRNNRQTPAFEAWAEKTFMVHEASCSGRRAWCSCCGQAFDVPKGATTEVTCPHCGDRLTIVKSRRQIIHRDGIYAQEIKTCGEDWQIVRTYHITVDCHRDYKGGVHAHRVYDKWVNRQGKAVVIARNIKTFPNYCRVPWSLWDTDWDGKEKQFSMRRADGYWYSGWDISATYPHVRIQPWLTRCGLTKDTHGFDFGDLMTDMPNTIAETFYKEGQWNLCRYALYGSSWHKEEYLAAMKVAKRHGFDFEALHKMSDYIDYLEQLDRLGMDLRNPVNVAPANLQEAHERLMTEEERRREREEARREELARMTKAERDRAAQEAYAKAKAKFLDLTFEAQGLNFHVLQSVKEFYETGKAMHICVYSNEYYAKDSSLIMCASDTEGKRVEIVEVDLKGWKILQSRAVCNGTSDRHKDIISIVNSNMGLIRKAARASA